MVNYVDNAVDDILLQEINSIVFDHNSFPWYYTSTVYENTTTTVDGYSWYHVVYFNGEIRSPVYNHLVTALKQCLNLTNQKLSAIIRIKIGLVTHNHRTFHYEPHVDHYFPHETGLLYLNDCDGDTVFFDKKFGDETKNFNIVKSITPKKNRFAWFDGLQYHSNFVPNQSPKRVVVNFNYRVGER